MVVARGAVVVVVARGFVVGGLAIAPRASVGLGMTVATLTAGATGRAGVGALAPIVALAPRPRAVLLLAPRLGWAAVLTGGGGSAPRKMSAAGGVTPVMVTPGWAVQGTAVAPVGMPRNLSSSAETKVVNI